MSYMRRLRFTVRGLVMLGLLSLVLTLVLWLPWRAPILVWLQSFGLHGAVGLFLLGALLLVLRRGAGLIAVAVAAASIVILLVVSAGRPGSSASDAAEVVVYQANINSANRNAVPIAARVRELGADVVVLQEIRESFDTTFRLVLDDYPHVATHSRPDNFGVAVYSRLPIFSSRVILLAGFPVMEVELDAGGSILRIFNVHLPPPLSTRYVALQRRILEELAPLVPDDVPTIVAGDFNSVPWSPELRGFLGAAGLSFLPGLPLATFPARYPLVRIPIDYILVDDRAVVVDRHRVDVAGSDHLGLVARLRLDSSSPAGR